MALTPRFTYPGLDPRFVRDVQYTLAHGISPGVIVVQVPAGVQPPAAEGTAVFSLGSTSIEILGCKLDIGASQVGGGRTWTFSILDGRWRWEFGTITGHYNLRRVTDGGLRTETEQTPRALAQKCLKELRVSDYNIDALPDIARPECHWSYMPPAQALAQLADAVGCRVVVTTKGKVIIVRGGEGADLPDLPTIDNGYSIDTGAFPSAVLVIGAPGLFQARWKLIAVGQDTDGKIKPIDELSYKPSTGWESEVPGHMTGVAEGTDKTKPDPRRLAIQTVFRWYRIDKMVDGDDLPGLKNTKVDKKDGWKKCLPLQDGLLDTFEDSFSKQLQRQPAVIRGTFQDDEFTYDAVVDGQFRGDFSVRGESGVIAMAQPLYRIDGDDIKPADITVEIAFEWRKEFEEPYRPTWRYTVKPRPDVGDHPLPREEIKFTARWEYDSKGKRTKQTDNRQKDKLDDQAQYAAAVFVTSLGNVQAGDRTYSGLHSIEPDGAIRQVSWHFGAQSLPTTRGSRNSEFDSDIIPPYAARRRAEQQRQLMVDIRRMTSGKSRDK